MREIKFRAWDFIENMMMDAELSYGIQYNKNKVEIISQKDCFVFLQYTGLKDKNDVEIYEYMEIDDNFEVSFKDGCYVLTNISNGDIILLYNYLRDKNGQVAVTKEYTKI